MIHSIDDVGTKKILFFIVMIIVNDETRDGKDE